MNVLQRIVERTGAEPEDVMNVVEIMDYFLEGFKGTRKEAVRHLRRMKRAMFIEISEADWLEWLRRDRRRWKYVEKCLKKFDVKSKYSLINLSYFLYISDIYDMVLRQIEKAVKSN